MKELDRLRDGDRLRIEDDRARAPQHALGARLEIDLDEPGRLGRRGRHDECFF